jgi:hypothetical protein
MSVSGASGYVMEAKGEIEQDLVCAENLAGFCPKD